MGIQKSFCSSPNRKATKNLTTQFSTEIRGAGGVLDVFTALTVGKLRNDALTVNKIFIFLLFDLARILGRVSSLPLTTFIAFVESSKRLKSFSSSLANSSYAFSDNSTPRFSLIKAYDHAEKPKTKGCFSILLSPLRSLLRDGIAYRRIQRNTSPFNRQR
jgi:hypothetical protein